MSDNTAVYGCTGCATTAGRAGCETHRDRPSLGANIYITTCLHGLDLRIHPRCFLCRPLTEAEMHWWITSHGLTTFSVPA